MKAIAKSDAALHLTRQQYIMDYEKHRALLQIHAHSIAYHTWMAAAGLVMFVVGYEIIARGLSWAFGKIGTRKPKELA